MKITLAELIPIKVHISKKIQETLAERERNSFIEYEKNERKTAEMPTKSFKEYSDELQELREDYREVCSILTKSNVNFMVEWEDGGLSIAEALELAKQLRGEMNNLKLLSNRNKITRDTGSFGSTWVTYKEALYDPDELSKKAEKLNKKANRLSIAIEKTNHKKEVEFSKFEKYT